jgi:hypothetical protein
MRAPLSPLLLATAWLAGAGCASKHAQEPPTASASRACENAAGNWLHLASTSSFQATAPDPDVDTILTQPTTEQRLAQINRRMYQSLRSLDDELRREESLAACKEPAFANPALQAQAGNQSGAKSAGASGAATEVSSSDTGTTVTVLAMPSATPSVAMAAAGTAHALGKTSMSSGSGGGGNGATAPKIVPGSDNDVVARRLRRAAEQESNPALRAKLWKEYTEYRHGTSTK